MYGTETPSVVQRNLPIMTSRKLAHMPIGVRPQQAWIETLSSVEDEKLGIIDLHPNIFGLPPRFETFCIPLTNFLPSNVMHRHDCHILFCRGITVFLPN